MKRTLMITVFGVSLLISGCKATLSETALQTAVSEAIMTSSRDTAGEESLDIKDKSVEDNASQTELDDTKAQLSDAQVQLTAQAAKVIELQVELERVYSLLTPTNTPEPPPITNTPQPTSTPEPTATNQGGLLYNQKYVIAPEGVPVYTYEDENEAGYPIMFKVNPVKKFSAGEKIIVSIYPIRGDGGIYYYLVVGPSLGGYYIPVGDVQDYSG